MKISVISSSLPNSELLSKNKTNTSLFLTLLATEDLVAYYSALLMITFQSFDSHLCTYHGSGWMVNNGSMDSLEGPSVQ